jgi:hypothetical protein
VRPPNLDRPVEKSDVVATQPTRRLNPRAVITGAIFLAVIGLAGRGVLAARDDPTASRPHRRVFPSESAIDGLVRINQMGAALGEVRTDWLICGCSPRFILAVLAARRGRAREEADALACLG